MFEKILIANRGEIACRILLTAQKMGIKTVAVYSTADEHARHVHLADEAFCIGPANSKDSYLNSNNIIEVAKATGAQAIHPGYGFLAENAEFSRQCQQFNIKFIGPSPDAIATMGDKSAAKKTVIAAGVPVTPGYHGADQSTNTLTLEAKKMGVPLLIKTVAGGGGKGMRLVDDLSDFNAALQSAQREAKASFNNDAVFLEKYIQSARHIELQVFADQHGNAVHLFDRDCSVQRRHQKIIEEAPAPGLSASLREKMAKTAVAAITAIQYEGAGTIEFLVDSDDNFYFMEMNTRLQVEHPVTEMITGVDLVEWQIRVAAGEPLPLQQQDIQQTGHAFEARICAENPFNRYAPSTGTLHYFHLPDTNDNIRIDTGVRAHDAISPYYDSLILKLISFASTRDAALEHLQTALENTHILGVHTNTALLHRIAKHTAFINAELSIQFLSEHPEILKPHDNTPIPALIAATLVYSEQMEQHAEQLALESEDVGSPWFIRDHWRSAEHSFTLSDFWDKNNHYKIEFSSQDNDFLIQIADTFYSVLWRNESDTACIFNFDDQTIRTDVILHDDQYHIFYEGEHYPLLTEDPQMYQLIHSGGDSQITSPMPGNVVDVFIKPGQAVKKGEKLLVIEAMKMEHALFAPTDGTVKTIFNAAGDQVIEGAALVEFE